MPDISLKRVDNGVDKPRLHAIFVHGLGGDPIGTWCGKGIDESNFWLKGIAEGIDNIAVYTLGYPGDKATWNTGWPINTAAVAVLDKLMSSKQLRASGGAPIAFVCHSLGGLIIKKLVLIAHLDRGQQPTKGRFLDRIAGIVFLSTPHDGSIVASIASSAHWFASKSLSDLKASDEALLDIGHTYRDRVANKEILIRHRVYYETVGKWGAKSVTAASADPGLPGVRPVPVKRDHMSICKPTTEDDPVYEGILAFLHDEVLQPRESNTCEDIAPLQLALVTPANGNYFVPSPRDKIEDTTNRLKEIMVAAKKYKNIAHVASDLISVHTAETCFLRQCPIILSLSNVSDVSICEIEIELIFSTEFKISGSPASSTPAMIMIRSDHNDFVSKTDKFKLVKLIHGSKWYGAVLPKDKLPANAHSSENPQFTKTDTQNEVFHARQKKLKPGESINLNCVYVQFEYSVSDDVTIEYKIYADNVPAVTDGKITVHVNDIT